jgi:hypothetical protein
MSQCMGVVTHRSGGTTDVSVYVFKSDCTGYPEENPMTRRAPSEGYQGVVKDYNCTQTM